MKIQLSQVFFSILLLSSCFLLGGCTKKGDSTTNTMYYYLTDDEKSKIPYTSSQVLSFVSAAGDTFTLYPLSGKETDFAQYTPNQAYERLTMTYTGNKPPLTYMALSINYYWKEFLYPYKEIDHAIDFHINDRPFIASLLSLSDSLYHDTVTINGQLLKGIEIAAYDSSKILYNHKIGILRITLSNNQVWKKL